MLKGLLVYLYTQCGLDEVKLLRIIMEGRTVVGIFYVDKIYSKTRTRSGFNPTIYRSRPVLNQILKAPPNTIPGHRQ
jgi:hypothetical protein